MNIEVAGFYGWGNAGDEGILLSIIDGLGYDHEYWVSTPLPFTFAEDYLWRLPRMAIEYVREIEDLRTDYDVYLLGGGGLNIGFGWRQALAAFVAEKASINYGVGYSRRTLYNPRLKGLYREFLSRFDAITVRDEDSKDLLKEIGVDSTLTMCPAINLREERWTCPERMVAVCPRLEDSGDDEPQIEWLVSRLQDIRDEVLLIPFHRVDRRDNPADLRLCTEISKRLGGARILELDGFFPREIKYVISKSKLLISGGRYHAVMWAAAHNVPYEVCPTGLVNYSKVESFIKMHEKYGIDKLKQLAELNKEVFQEVVERRGLDG